MTPEYTLAALVFGQAPPDILGLGLGRDCRPGRRHRRAPVRGALADRASWRALKNTFLKCTGQKVRTGTGSGSSRHSKGSQL